MSRGQLTRLQVSPEVRRTLMDSIASFSATGAVYFIVKNPFYVISNSTWYIYSSILPLGCQPVFEKLYNFSRLSPASYVDFACTAGKGEPCSHSTAGVTIGRPHRVQSNQAFPPWGKVACIRRMRGSHSSEWRLYSTERGCFRRMLAHPTPHQSLSAEDVFRFRLRNRRCSADEEKLRETHRVSYSYPPSGGAEMTHKHCRGDCRIARTHCGKNGRFVNRPYRMAGAVYTP